MFWSFCLQPNFILSGPVPMIVPANSSVQQCAGEKEYEVSTGIGSTKTKTPLLHLTAKDLMKAGYENKKKPWTEDEDEKLKELRG